MIVFFRFLEKRVSFMGVFHFVSFHPFFCSFDWCCLLILGLDGRFGEKGSKLT